MSRKRAIRKKCLDCCAGQHKMVRLCPATDCPIWIYRSGRKTPKKEVFSEEKSKVDPALEEEFFEKNSA